MVDQITVKVHNFVKDYASDIIEQLKKINKDAKWKEIVIYSIAMYRFQQEFEAVDWKNKVKVKHYIEGLLNDIYYLEEKGIITVKVRGLKNA